MIHEDANVTFAEADFIEPVSVIVKCPICEHAHEFDETEVTEDDIGVFRVTESSRFQPCEGCGALIDFGAVGLHQYAPMKEV